MNRLLIILLLLTSGAPALADPLAAGYAPPQAPPPPNPTGLLLRLLVLTAATLAICGGVLWLARRSARARIAGADGAGKLTHLGSLTLDRRSTVHVISVEGQQVAVAVDASGLRSMTVLSEPFPSALERQLESESPPL